MPELRLPVTRADDLAEDLTCLLCGEPRDGVTYADPEYMRCEFVVTYRFGGTTCLAGLHRRCWERNGGGDA